MYIISQNQLDSIMDDSVMDTDTIDGLEFEDFEFNDCVAVLTLIEDTDCMVITRNDNFITMQERDSEVDKCFMIPRVIVEPFYST